MVLQVIEANQIGMPGLDIMVPVHNNVDMTVKCLKAIYFNTQTPFHLIVCNASDDNGLNELYLNTLVTKGVAPLGKVSNLTIINNTEGDWKEGNEFFNVALRYCKSEYLATVMSSMRVEPEWELFALNTLMPQNPNVGIIGFKCLFGGDTNKVGHIESAGIKMLKYIPTDIGRDMPGHRLTGVYEPDAIQWAFALLRKKAAIGNLEEGVFHGHVGWDDIDNSFAVKAKGWKILYCGLGVGYHEPRATRGDNSPEAARKNMENGEKFYKRWGFWDMFIADHPLGTDVHVMPKEIQTVQEVIERANFQLDRGEVPV